MLSVVALFGVPDSTAQGSGSGLVAVRVGSQGGTERVVFEFQGAAPSFQSIKYVPRIKEDGSGRPVPVAGSAFLEAVFMDSCAEAVPGASCPPPPSVPAGFRTLRQVVAAGEFESNVTYGIGLRSRVKFRVFTLSNPTRVVVEVPALRTASPAQPISRRPSFTG